MSTIFKIADIRRIILSFRPCNELTITIDRTVWLADTVLSITIFEILVSGVETVILDYTLYR